MSAKTKKTRPHPIAIRTTEDAMSKFKALAICSGCTEGDLFGAMVNYMTKEVDDGWLEIVVKNAEVVSVR